MFQIIFCENVKCRKFDERQHVGFVFDQFEIYIRNRTSVVKCFYFYLKKHFANMGVQEKQLKYFGTWLLHYLPGTPQAMKVYTLPLAWLLPCTYVGDLHINYWGKEPVGSGFSKTKGSTQ